MSRLFGYGIDPNFDSAGEARRDRLGWVLIGGVILSLLYLFSGRPFATEVFQGSFATILCYGASFYADRRKYLGKWWLWKAILATVPLHVIYLAGLFSADKAFPGLMTKAIVFIPILAVGFVVESRLFDSIASRFKPSRLDHVGASIPRT